MLVTSRSFAEYEAFFALTPDDLAGRTLDFGTPRPAEGGGRR